MFLRMTISPVLRTNFAIQRKGRVVGGGVPETPN